MTADQSVSFWWGPGGFVTVLLTADRARLSAPRSSPVRHPHYPVDVVPTESLLAFVVAALVLIVIPGPSVLFTIGRALALGRIGGLLSVLGNALGLLPVIGLVALGVGGIVAQSVVLFTIVKVAGALYLMFLGVQAIRHRNRTAEAAISGAPRARTGASSAKGSSSA